MSYKRPPVTAAFVKLIQEAREETLKNAYTNMRFPDGYNAATQDVLDVIHTNGYVILDKDGNRVNPPEHSLACGIWFKEQE